MNLPCGFIERTKPLLKQEWEAFLSALNNESPVSIRLNKNKNIFINETIVNKVPWCNEGFYLPQRPQFTFDPLFHAGCYYVQEASSMFVFQALKQYVTDDSKILDLCAAPGGKSTLIADFMTDNSLLVTNDVIKSRAFILSENITKWGHSNAIVTNNDPSSFIQLKHYFDVVLVDAPCSGEGMFRKDAGAIEEWSLDNVKLCVERQRRILSDVWNSLKPNGILIYSTCTYNVEENEDNVLWIKDKLGADILPLELEKEWGVSPSVKGDIPVYRFFPHKTKGEGFFLAVLRKHDDNINPSKRKKEKNKVKNKDILSKDYRDYINLSDSFYYSKGENWYAIPNTFKEDISFIDSYLNVISSGIKIGETKGKDFIPAQSLALSNFINRMAFAEYELDWKNAISYLKREPLVLTDAPIGYILLTYKNTPIGFAKNIKSRANNLYPQEWRIRSNNLPDSEVNVF